MIRDAAGQDLLSHGTFWIEPATGRVVQTDFRVEDDTIGLTIEMIVRYQANPELGMLVPATMTERYSVEANVAPAGSTAPGVTTSSELKLQRQFLTNRRMTNRVRSNLFQLPAVQGGS